MSSFRRPECRWLLCDVSAHPSTAAGENLRALELGLLTLEVEPLDASLLELEAMTSKDQCSEGNKVGEGEAGGGGGFIVRWNVQ